MKNDPKEKISSLNKKYYFSVKINQEEKGTGFLCKIQYQDQSIIALFTVYNILLKGKDTSQKNELVDCFCLQKEKEETIIDLKKNRRKFIFQEYNLIMIEIKTDLDKIKFDETIREAYLEKENNKKGFYVENDEEIFKSYKSFTEINKEENNKRENFCSPIISSDNNKIIGIYYEKDKNHYKKLLMEEIKDSLGNEINIKYKISNDDNNSTIKIFGEEFCEKNKENAILIINGEEKELKADIEKPSQTSNGIIEIKLKKKKPITNMSRMFWYCKSLFYIDFSNWSTLNVTDMCSLFYYCIFLEKIDGISNFDTSNVTDISYMFYRCKNLKFQELDISKWDVSKVIKMNDLFSNCKYTEYLPDISKWNVSKVRDASNLFEKCISLKAVPDISEWNTSNLEDISNLFYDCKLLKELPDISKWNASNITEYRNVFYNIKPEIAFPIISKWNKKNISKNIIISPYQSFISFQFNNDRSLISNVSNSFQLPKLLIYLLTQTKFLNYSLGLLFLNQINQNNQNKLIFDPIIDLFKKKYEIPSLFLFNTIDVAHNSIESSSEISISLNLQKIFNIYLLIKRNYENINYINILSYINEINRYKKNISQKKTEKFIISIIIIEMINMMNSRNIDKNHINKKKMEKIMNYYDDMKKNIHCDIKLNEEKMDIEEIYTDILISLIKNNKYEEDVSSFNTIDELSLDSINTSKIMIKKLIDFFNSNEEYINTNRIKNIKDLFDSKIINFYYFLLKYVFKHSIYIYNIPFLLDSHKIIIKAIKDNNSDLHKIFFYKNKDKIEYIIKTLSDSEYYFKELNNFKLNCFKEIYEYYKYYLFETKKIEIKLIKEDIIQKEEITSKYNYLLKDYDLALKFNNYINVLNYMYGKNEKTEEEIKEHLNYFEKWILNKKYNKLSRPIKNLLADYFIDENKYEISEKIGEDLFNYYNGKSKEYNLKHNRNKIINNVNNSINEENLTVRQNTTRLTSLLKYQNN